MISIQDKAEHYNLWSSVKVIIERTIEASRHY